MKKAHVDKIRVLIVDDSPFVRAQLSKILSFDPMIEVVGSAPDAFVAREMLVRYAPDVMTLDLEMPKLDGLNFLEKVMRHFPTRTVVVSGFTSKDSQLLAKAKSAGAVDVMSKSDLDLSRGAQRFSDRFIQRIRAAARAPLLRNKFGSRNLHSHPDLILAIAASTGGPDAIRDLLTQLPQNIPPTLIVQHMPALFTKSFAEGLNAVCRFEVREASDGDPLESGVALIAPGNFHMTVVQSALGTSIRLNRDPPMHGVRPAADPLFESIASISGIHSIGVVLTGMGRDGAQGLAKMRLAGSYTIAQDAGSSVVFGMPREAVDQGGVKIVSPLGKIPALIMSEVARRTVAKVS